MVLNLLTFFTQVFSFENPSELAQHHRDFLELHTKPKVLFASQNIQEETIEENQNKIKFGLKPLYGEHKKEIQLHLPPANKNTLTIYKPMALHLQKMQEKQNKNMNAKVTISTVSVNGFSTCAPLNQGNIGACTAFSFAHIVKVLKGILISPRYQYVNTCITEDQLYGYPKDPQSYLESDPGATLLGSLFTFFQNNATAETISLPVSQFGKLSSTYTGCSYNSNQSNFADILPPFSQQIALKLTKIGNASNPYLTLNQNLKYTDLLTPYVNKLGVIPDANTLSFVQAMVSALQKGSMIYVGVEVFSSFMNPKNGVIPMPNKDNLEGGHALAIGAYTNKYMSDLTYGTFQFINSWGTSWGDKGFGYFPVKYLMNYAIEIYAVSL